MMKKMKYFVIRKIRAWSLKMVADAKLINKLREIVPDISRQEPNTVLSDSYWELKRRAQHSFQCHLMLEALKCMHISDKLSVIDAGDSAGTHILYLKGLAKIEADSLSVNIDPKAVEQIRSRGLKAVCDNIETMVLDKVYDLCLCFQTAEHLYNPAVFFRSVRKHCCTMAISTPYMRNSRVGLYSIRAGCQTKSDHIFELSPEDWILLLNHCGWEVLYSKTYYQYPKIPFLAYFWRRTDFEGFWGAVLRKKCQ